MSMTKVRSSCSCYDVGDSQASVGSKSKDRMRRAQLLGTLLVTNNEVDVQSLRQGKGVEQPDAELIQTIGMGAFEVVGDNDVGMGIAAVHSVWFIGMRASVVTGVDQRGCDLDVLHAAKGGLVELKQPCAVLERGDGVVYGGVVCLGHWGMLEADDVAGRAVQFDVDRAAVERQVQLADTVPVRLMLSVLVRMAVVGHCRAGGEGESHHQGNGSEMLDDRVHRYWGSR